MLLIALLMLLFLYNCPYILPKLMKRLASKFVYFSFSAVLLAFAICLWNQSAPLLQTVAKPSAL
jgi:hypothetical protein